MNLRLKIMALVVIAANLVYLGWLATNVIGGLGALLFVAEAMLISLTTLFAINHWSQKHIAHHHSKPKGSVDVFLTIVDEPIELFEKTVKAAMAIDYIDKVVYILDDGRRSDVKSLSDKYGAKYLARNNRQDYKAGNLNFGLINSASDYILVLDSDQVVKPEIIHDLLGYFAENEKLAIISTRQDFDVPESDFNHDFIFYNHMQAGKNSDNAAISCGSGVFYRRSALKKVGGFQTWNVVEDLYTSYVLHNAGYDSIYITRPYTKGFAPLDLSTIYKQRGTWAVDTLRLFFRRSPLFFSRLSIRQKLHYLEIGWAYVVSAVALPILFTLPIITVFLNIYIVMNPSEYLFYRIPSLLLVIVFYYILAERHSSASQFWAGLSPVYLKALILSLMPFKIRYRVTDKLAGVGKRDIGLILPHLGFIVLALLASGWRLYVDGSVTSFLGINLMWMTLMIFWFYPIIRKGFLLE